MATLKLELKATQDDLTKAKGNYASSQKEIQTLTQQVSDLKVQLADAQAAASSDEKLTALLSKTQHELESTQDELAMTKGAFEATKESFSRISDSHDQEMESKTTAHVEEVQKLRGEFENEKKKWVEEMKALRSELEDEKVAKEHAKAEALAAQSALRTPPMSPKANGTSNTTNPLSPPTAMVPREELQKVHEAHSAKLSEVEAGYQKAVKDLEREIESVKERVVELENSVDSKELELKYAASEKEELEDELARIKDSIGAN